MRKVIIYTGNDKENYTLVLNPDEKYLATFDLETDNQIMLGEDQTMLLVADINALILPFILNDDLTISIKNDGDCLGFIIDVWEKEELIATDTIWFDSYHEDNEESEPVLDKLQDEPDYDNDENYGLFVVNPDDWNDDWDDDWGYDNVRELAVDSYRAETKENLLTTLIKGINDDTLSDMNWYFLVDLKEETILEYPTCLQS